MKKLVHIAVIVIALLFQLPIEATVRSQGMPGAGWVESGDMNCSYAAACQRWKAMLEYQGWKMDRLLFTTGTRQASQWSKQDKVISLMLWEEEIARTGFSWGLLPKEAKMGEGGAR